MSLNPDTVIDTWLHLAKLKTGGQTHLHSGRASAHARRTGSPVQRPSNGSRYSR